jgi:hypothetical protein
MHNETASATTDYASDANAPTQQVALDQGCVIIGMG